MSMSSSGRATLEALRGSSLGISDWLTVDQDMIDAHARTTGDRDWLHNDVERARREGPFGSTIAQGSLLIGNLVRLQEQVMSTVDDARFAYALNYGFNRIRFVRPVPAGGRVRLHLAVQDVQRREDGRWVLTLDVRLELDGAEQPALVAEWLGLLQEAGG
jgi:acyl dehydratase